MEHFEFEVKEITLGVYEVVMYGNPDGARWNVIKLRLSAQEVTNLQKALANCPG